MLGIGTNAHPISSIVLRIRRSFRTRNGLICHHHLIQSPSTEYGHYYGAQKCNKHPRCPSAGVQAQAHTQNLPEGERSFVVAAYADLSGERANKMKTEGSEHMPIQAVSGGSFGHDTTGPQTSRRLRKSVVVSPDSMPEHICQSARLVVTVGV